MTVNLHEPDAHQVKGGKSAVRRRLRICVMGTAVGSGNRGVLALASSLVKLLTECGNDPEVVFLIGNNKSVPVSLRIGRKHLSIPVVNFRLSPKSAMREHLAFIVAASILYRLVPSSKIRGALRRFCPWIGTVAGADLVGDVRGGDSFSDIYGFKRFVIGFLAAWSVILVRGEMVQFPQTFGPFKSPLARGMARYLLRRSSVIVARDKESQSVAQELVGDVRQVILSPDVAFALEPVKPERLDLHPMPQEPLSSNIIGLNVNGLMYNGGYTRNNMFGLKLDYPVFLNRLVVGLLKEFSGDLWLVPHTFAPKESVESDQEACRKVREAVPEELRQRVRLVTTEYDQNEIKGVIGMCEFFVGSRMHSCIAALSQGIPCVGVAYSMKFAGVFDSVGMIDWVVDARKHDADEAAARIMTLFRGREAARAPLRTAVNAARSSLSGTFGQLTRMPKDDTGRSASGKTNS